MSISPLSGHCGPLLQNAGHTCVKSTTVFLGRKQLMGGEGYRASVGEMCQVYDPEAANPVPVLRRDSNLI